MQKRFVIWCQDTFDFYSPIYTKGSFLFFTRDVEME